MMRYRPLLLLFAVGILLLSGVYLMTFSSELSAADFDLTPTLTPVDPPEGTNTPTATPVARSYLAPVLKATTVLTPSPSPTLGPTTTPPPTLRAAP